MKLTTALIAAGLVFTASNIQAEVYSPSTETKLVEGCAIELPTKRSKDAPALSPEEITAMCTCIFQEVRTGMTTNPSPITEDQWQTIASDMKTGTTTPGLGTRASGFRVFYLISAESPLVKACVNTKLGR